MNTIPLFRPSMTDKEISAVTEVMKSGWLGLGSITEEFEKKFAKFVGSKFAVAVNSGTSALDLSLKALNIKDGEIIVPALTFVSTGLVGLYNGCKIVFADIDEETLCINWKDVYEKTNENTKAIIPVHYGGKSAKIPDGFTGVIIEDCAHAVGNKQVGKYTACWSFHAVKNLTTGTDGGMITTNDEEVYKRLRTLRWCGINKSTYERAEKRYGWSYEVEEIGYKAHMSDLEASIGLVQLERIEELNNKRKLRVLQYLYELNKIKWLKLPKYDKDSAWHMMVVRIEPEERDKFIDYLLAHDISAGVHYQPLSHYKIFPKTELPVTDRVWLTLVTLPLFFDMTDDQFEQIVSVIKQYKS